MEDLKPIFAENLQKLRLDKGETQLEFADAVGYSDKAVSKWERGESLPDLATAAAVAEHFHVTVDWMLTPHEKYRPDAPHLKRQHRMITMLGVLAVWLLSVIEILFAYFFLHTFHWMTFVLAVPLSFLLIAIFNEIWGNAKKPIRRLLSLTAFVWTFLPYLYLLILLLLGWNLWPLFLVGVPCQLALIVWYRMVINHGRVKIEKETLFGRFHPKKSENEKEDSRE